MKKQICRFLLLPLALALALAGCRGPVSLSQRAFVRQVGIARAGAGWQVRLLAFAADAAAAGEGAAGQTRALSAEGGGDSLDAALLDAQAQLGYQPFYGQNELLLVERQTAASALAEVLRFAGSRGLCRPGALVFACRGGDLPALSAANGAAATLAALARLDQNGAAPVSELCRFDLVSAEAVYLLPLLRREGETLTADTLLLVRAGGGALPLTGEEKALAEVLLGASDTLPLAGGTLRQLTLQKQVTRDGRLLLRLRGTLEAPPGGAAQQAKSARRLQAVFARLYQRCCEKDGPDPFGFAWQLKLRNAAAVTALERQKMLFTPDRVLLQAELTVCH